MEEIDLKKIMEHDDLRIIAEMAAELGVDAYLVGGGLRDYLLGRETNDLDFALSGAWEKFPRTFAVHVCGTFFWLDKNRKQSRVVKKKGDEISVFDFAPLRGRTITDDLALRDFTFNAMAMQLSGDCFDIIDPLQGLNDIRNRMIRACAPAAFDDDPLRLLRAIRFSAELGFEIENTTWESLSRKANLLSGVAAERVKDELFRILAAPGCGISVKRLCESGLWAEIILEREWVIREVSIARAEEAERLCMEVGSLFPGSSERLVEYLDRKVEATISFRSMIKLAAVLGRGERGGTAPLAERLRLGKEAGKLLEYFCRDEREVYGMLERSTAERVVYRFFRDREPAGLGMLFTARTAGTISDLNYSRLIEYWLREYDAEDAELFLTGGEIMAILGVHPGKTVGEAMERLREAEGTGQVNSREEARVFIKNLLTSKPTMR
jgi:poly(A) polymerase